MDQALIGAAVGATIQVLLQNLLTKSIEEIKLVSDYKKHLTKLKNTLLMVQAFLADAEEKQDNPETVKLWMERLEDVAYEADALLDDINYERLRCEVEKQNGEISKKVICFFSSDCFSSGSLFFRRKMAHKIKDVNNKFELINKEAKDFGLQEQAAGSFRGDRASSVISFEQKTHSFPEPNIVGRENDVAKVVEMLVNAPTDETFSIMRIVGMGGLGKTALAQKVFNHEKMHAYFQEKIWICISVHLDAALKLILESLTRENVQGIMNKQVVVEKIRERLAGKKYLLVLDDVWNDEVDMWEEFLNTLSAISSVKGNGIIITTRKEYVGLVSKTLPTYRIKRLSDDDCWSIIKARASSRINDSREFEEIGKQIAKKCGGLPLAAKVVGGLLLLYGHSKDEWVSMLNNQLSHFVQDNKTIEKILKLSYDRLPSSSLKKCFAYCSIFPQDYIIKRDELIELWMSEGFLQVDQRSEMEFVGNNYFNHLLQNSLFQEAKMDEYGNILTCRMHDLVHDMASSVSRSNYTHQVRYLFHTDGRNVNLHEQAEYLRTLCFRGNITCLMLSGFKYLHVLKLIDLDIEELPIVIRDMMHLRYLEITKTRIKNLPDSIGKLYHLQTLKILDLNKLPNTIIDLTSLRHLHIASIKLPPGIGNLTSLRTLEYYKVGREKGNRIGELGKLEYLGGKLEIENLEMVINEEEAKHANLFGKPNIWSLVLKWNESREGENKDEGVLQGLQPHQDLKGLTIDGYNGRNFPLWTMRMEAYNDLRKCWIRLSNLMNISLTACNQCEGVPMLGHLPHLKELEMKYMPNVRSIGLAFYGFENRSTSTMTSDVNFQGIVSSFPALKKLYLWGMHNLTEWVSVEGTNVVFPCLIYLSIDDCPKLKCVPNHFASLEELRIYNVDSDFPLTDMCSRETCLHTLRLDTLPGLISLRGHSNGFTSLRRLEIRNCKKFSDLPQPCSTLETLTISRCQELKSISQVRGESRGFTSLRVLEIENCENFTDLPSEVLESCTCSLERLTLSNLDNFLDATTVIRCLSTMSLINHLDLVKLPKLEKFPTEIGFPSTLQLLHIGGFSNSLDLVSSSIFERLTSLSDFCIFGQQNWHSIPDQIQHLTSLERLHICEFEIEALPEWIGNLCMLQELYIYNCKKMLHLPSKETMQCLTKLSVLGIIGSPLRERCRKPTQQQLIEGNDSEWPKIAHLADKLIIY